MALPSYLRRLRNAWLTHPSFINFAQRFPLTRPVARARSLELFDILAGFAYAQVLYACVSLKLFEHVGNGALSITELSTRAQLPPDKLTMLIRAAVALKLFEWDGDDVILGPQGAALLGQPWIMRFVEHHRHFYRDLEDPVALLRGNAATDGLRSYWNYADAQADKSRYSALMAASQQAVAAQILQAYDFSKHRSLLDVGGGTGAFLRAVSEAYPKLNLHLFDLPGVVALADTESSGSPAITRHAGDFRRDPLPAGPDIISIVRVIHDHDDEAVMDLLGNVRRVATPQTTLLVAEPFAGQPRTARVTDAYFNLYFAAMGQGRTRTPAEITQMAAKAGFEGARQWTTNLPLITGVMTFRPRGA